MILWGHLVGRKWRTQWVKEEDSDKKARGTFTTNSVKIEVFWVDVSPYLHC
jgi:hypothetical protein